MPIKIFLITLTIYQRVRKVAKINTPAKSGEVYNKAKYKVFNLAFHNVCFCWYKYTQIYLFTKCL